MSTKLYGTTCSSPEYDALEIKWIFDNASGRDPNPQHILLGGKIGGLGDPVQWVQVTTETQQKMISRYHGIYNIAPAQADVLLHSLFSGIWELVLPPSIITLLDAGVTPQVLDGVYVRTLQPGDLLYVHLSNNVGISLVGEKTLLKSC